MRLFIQGTQILSAMCLWAIVPMQAQSADTVRTAIITFAPAGLPQDFTAFYDTGESIRSFEPSSKNLSRAVVYSGPRRLVLRSSEEEFALAAKEPANIPPLASVELPIRASMVLLLAVPYGDSGGIRLRAYDISTDELKPGGYRIFNFSSKDLMMAMNEERFRIRSAEDTQVTVEEWTKEPLALSLMIASNTPDGYDLVYSSYYSHFPTRRSLIFLFDGNHPSRPIIFSSFNAGASPIKPTEN